MSTAGLPGTRLVLVGRLGDQGSVRDALDAERVHPVGARRDVHQRVVGDDLLQDVVDGL